MKLHITITDNETGNVIHEADTNAVIAGCKTEEGAAAICSVKCDDIELASAIFAAEEAIRAIKKQKGFMFAILTKVLPMLLNAAKKKEAKDIKKAMAKAAESAVTDEDIK